MKNIQVVRFSLWVQRRSQRIDDTLANSIAHRENEHGPEQECIARILARGVKDGRRCEQHYG